MKRRLLLVALAALAAPSPSPLTAQSMPPRAIPARQLDAYLDRLALYGGSGAVAVTRNGKVVYRRGFGFADRDRLEKMTPTHGVDIASMSKDMTTVAVLQLVDEGRLRLTDSLATLLDSVPPDKRGITVQQLIRHRAGLQEYVAPGRDFTVYTRSAALDSILSGKLQSAPGASYSYSNAGFTLLAIIVERITGQPIEDVFRTKQFERLGLKASHSYGTTSLQAERRLAHGYVERTDYGTPAGYVKSSDYWILKGAGGVVSTVEDILAWDNALLSSRLLTPAATAALHDSTARGVGTHLRLPSGRRAWVRTGAQDYGFAAGSLRYPDEGTVIAVAVNRQPYGMDIAPARDILLATMDAFMFGTPPALPPEGRLLKASLPRDTSAWTLPDGSTLTLINEGTHLVARPYGPVAVEMLVSGSDTTGRENRLRLARLAAEVVTSFCRNDPAPLRAAIIRTSDRTEAFLKRLACPDSAAPATIRAVGAVPRWWVLPVPSPTPATILEIVPPTGRPARMRFEWDANGKITATGGGGVNPPIVEFVSAPGGGYVGFDLGLRKAVRFSISGEELTFSDGTRARRSGR